MTLADGIDSLASKGAEPLSNCKSNPDPRAILQWKDDPRIVWPRPRDPPRLDYLMAFFSQIAYVPTRFEASNQRGTKVVPSRFFQDLANRGRALDVARLVRDAFPQELDMPVRVVSTANSITLIARVKEVVIIASRGTILFHSLLRPSGDVGIDLNAWPIAYGSADVSYHFGFLEEACASLPQIVEAYRHVGEGLPIYFTGHSLGGALAAVNDRLWDESLGRCVGRKTIVFGCPRFGNDAAVKLRPVRAFVRPGDPVPNLPPRIFGYADIPNSEELRDPDSDSWNIFKNHAIEGYRRAIAHRDEVLAEDERLYRLFEIAMAKEPRQWGF
ncbi:MAG: hypothetical protein KF780_12095 [Sphingomonas sp.]|nr:hypothetical protein [Sphingomonas sp.]